MLMSVATLLRPALAAGFILIHGVAPALAQNTAPDPPPPPAGKLSGLVFGDYYSFPQQHLASWKGQHGFWIRRAYFTYDHTFTPKLTTRLRFEVNSNGKLAGGALTPYVKDAFVKWTFHGRQVLTAGIQPTLTFDYVESVWGLRHVEKTPVDLYRVDGSRDTGITLSGPLNASQTLKYAVQYGNESGSNAETDRFKSYRASARYETNPGLTAEAVVAHFDRDSDADRETAQLFAAYRAPRARVGAQYSFQKRRGAEGSPVADIQLGIVSGFAVVDLKPKITSAFLRIDRVNDPCADCSGIDYLPIAPTHPFTMTLAGVEYALHASVRVSPNVEWVRYSERAGMATPKHDVAARVTFYWIW
jgi:hypothetical protein